MHAWVGCRRGGGVGLAQGCGGRGVRVIGLVIP